MGQSETDESDILAGAAPYQLSGAFLAEAKGVGVEVVTGNIRHFPASAAWSPSSCLATFWLGTDNGPSLEPSA
jgi:hypothetical protein